MVNNAKMKAELSLLEDTILQMLSASKGNILDDENLITTLAVSKVLRPGLFKEHTLHFIAFASCSCSSYMLILAVSH